MTPYELTLELIWLALPVATAWNLPLLIKARIKERDERLNAAIFWYTVPTLVWLYFRFVY